MKVKHMTLKSRLCWALAGVLSAAWIVITVFPFLFMVLNSFKEKFEILTEGVFSWPKHFYLENYITVFEKGIGRYFFNSIVVCALSLIIALLVSACAAYPISRLKFKFNQY